MQFRTVAIVAVAAIAIGGIVVIASGPHAVDNPHARRYDCLLITDVDAEHAVATSPGFPRYGAPEEVLTDTVKAAPSAADRRLLLGTTVSIAVYAIPEADARRAVEGAFDRIAELSKKLSIFSPDSEVSRVNREAADGPVKISDDLARVIRQSLEVAELSEGAFDATVGPLTDLWRRYRRDGKIPTADLVDEARTRVGWRNVVLADGPTVQFKVKGMSFDFGGIAKGFAAEEAAAVLRKHGVISAIIDCGGDLKLIGRRPDGGAFRVGIDDPRRDGELRYVTLLADAGIVTSGNYRQFSVIDGKRYSHIIDPRTGQSIAALPSVTVIGPDSTMCDALATAISVLGEKPGLALIDKLNVKTAR